MATILTRGTWTYAKHLKLINKEICQTVDDFEKTVILSTPPRHGKSLLVSQILPFWYLVKNPNRRVIFATYSDEFAEGWGRKVRDLFIEWGPTFGVEIRRDSRAAARWEIAGHGGEYFAVGSGGAITGRGADLIICDDLIKNAEEALSETISEKHWDWFISTLESRKAPGAATIFIATRWSASDIPGRIKDQIERGERSPDSVRVVNLPALSLGDGDLLGRPEGEALWPEAYPARVLNEIKARASFWWNALYMGEPVPRGGVLFNRDWFKPFDWLWESGPNCRGVVAGGRKIVKPQFLHGAVPDKDGKMAPSFNPVMVVDASLGKKGSDFAALGIFGIDDQCSEVYVLHIDNRRIPIDVFVDEMSILEDQWRPDMCLIESNGFQVLLAKSARAVLRCPVIEIKPEGKSKKARAIQAIELAGSGGVYIPFGASWTGDFLTQLSRWTGADGEKDDIVDILCYAVRQMYRWRGAGALPSPGSSPYITPAGASPKGAFTPHAPIPSQSFANPGRTGGPGVTFRPSFSGPPGRPAITGSRFGRPGRS